MRVWWSACAVWSTAAHMSETGQPRVLIIPGLDGNTGLWRGVATTVLPGLRPLWFDHSMDRATDGLEGLARRALARARRGH